MKIWNAGICNIKGCERYRSLLWKGEKPVGNHAHCCCMCRKTNGKEHAYYCKPFGHIYLRDDRSRYSQVFVKDNGKEAADAAWSQQTWGDSSWSGRSWSSSWQSAWPEGVPDHSARGAEGEEAGAPSV